MENSGKNPACTLCKGETNYLFSKIILNKYSARYFECIACGSLQTENPFWLDESYSSSHITNLDTGIFQRNLSNLATTFLVSKLTNAKYVVDFGGGDGLLCRMLRDYGVNAYVYDSYATNTYAKGFDSTLKEKIDLVLAFEVFEHFKDPGSEIRNLFELNPKAILISTELYNNQNQNWWYLSAETGQHIFFFSKKAVKKIANDFGYYLISSKEITPLSGHILFLRSDLKYLRFLSMITINPLVGWLFKILLLAIPGFGAQRDHNKLSNNSIKNQKG